MSKDKNSLLLGRLADLLDKFAERLNCIANQTRQNTDAIASLESGTYLSISALQAQLKDRLQKTELMPLVATYCELGVRFLNNELYVGTEMFPFPEGIIGVATKPYGLLISLKNGDVYILCGGPTTSAMYLNIFKKAR